MIGPALLALGGVAVTVAGAHLLVSAAAYTGLKVRRAEGAAMLAAYAAYIGWLAAAA